MTAAISPLGGTGGNAPDRRGLGNRTGSPIQRRRRGAEGFLILLSLVVLLALWLGGAAGVAAQSPVTFEVTAEPDIVTVGDRIRVTATLTLPADAQADLKSLESQFGDLELLVVGLPQETTLPDGRRQVQQTYEVAAFRTGSTQLPALNLEVRLPDGSDVTATSGPLPINVQSVIPPNENPTDVRDLKPQISFPPVNGISWRSVALAVAAVSLALAAVLLLLRRLRRPHPVPELTPVPAPSPEAVARAELDRIAAAGMLEQGELKLYHAHLAACIRRYLTARYHFPAFAMTTTELRRYMQDFGIGRWQARLVTGLLTESDAVNFAQYVPAATRCEQNLEMAYQIVEAGEPAVETMVPATA